MAQRHDIGRKKTKRMDQGTHRKNGSVPDAPPSQGAWDRMRRQEAMTRRAREGHMSHG